MQKVFVIVPTLNAFQYVQSLSETLLFATTRTQVIIIDSSSDDEFPYLSHSISDHIQKIARSEFSHGGARNLGALKAQSMGAEILIFITQDVHAVNPSWIKNLIAPIVAGEAGATFARQLPRSKASLLEQFSRYFNYPEWSQSRTVADIKRLGVKAFFFSNVCSAVRADVFWSVGGFPEDVIMNEDMTLAARLLRAGHTIRYVAEAEVMHSHDYTIQQQFRRNFDVGTFFADAGPELGGASVGGEGLRFVREQLKYVLRHGRPDLLPLVIVEAAAKFTAFQLGKRHRLLPKSVKKYLSMHSYHWDQQKENV